ncbi:hypothetical protein [Roseomonas indoligenes]|uniref:Sialate O-acetylesterase domain-containing protein n=1 Tax=Roseomonas indoligenes TaxID=2820811 RepID=A0A940S7B5_9PROT|nr:hypothetical protein [Pararoseomonas indoligenes]MBP0492883.1 hypothetical protein [Pararoseomonas indoligenes]
MTAVTADLGLLPDTDVVRPRVWIGNAVTAEIQFRDEARKPAAVTDPVTFTWRSPANVLVDLPGVPVPGKPGLFRCAYRAPLVGERWAVRAQKGNDKPVLNWMLFDVVPEPPGGPVPQQAMWLASPDTALLSLEGTHLAGATIPDFPQVEADDSGSLPAGLLIPAVDRDAPGGPASVHVTQQAIRDDALATIAPQVEQVSDDAQAVEMSRQQVVGIREAIPGDVATEVGAKVPPAVDASVAAKVPPAVDTALAQKVAPAVADQVTAQIDPKVTAAQDARTGSEAARTGAQIAQGRSEDAANNTAASIANAARMALTLAALQASTPAPAAGALGVVYGAGTDRGLYQYLSGAWTYQGLTLADLLAMVSRSSNDPAGLVVKDANGNVGLELSGDGKLLYAAGTIIQVAANGTVTIGRVGSSGGVELLPNGQTRIGGVTLSQNAATDYQIGLADEFGNIIPLSMGGSSGGSGGGSTTTGFTAAELLGFDADVMAQGRGLASFRKALTQPPRIGAIGAINGAGQSLSVGGGFGPGITTVPLGNNWQIGTSQRFTMGGANAVPIGDANFHGLVSTSAAEFFQTTAVNAFLRLSAAHRGVPVTTPDLVLGSNATGYPGRSIELLSYGSAPEGSNGASYWSYMRDIVLAQKAAAQALGKPFVVLAILFDQGQANVAGVGLANSAEAWCALFLQYVADWITYILPLTDNEYPPLWVLNQTSGGFQQDTYQLGVSMGQILAAQRSPYVVLAQPMGNYQNCGTDQHPSANSHARAGNKLGQVLHEVINLGRSWEPLRPMQILWRGREVLIGLNPRKGPIRFASPFNGWTRVDPATVASKGFTVTDSLGALTVTAVDIVGQATIRLTVNRTPQDAPWVTAGSAAAGSGRTFVEDSDDQLAFEAYRYLPPIQNPDGTTTARMDPAENLPAEIGKPYSMANQLLTFRQQAVAA